MEKWRNRDWIWLVGILIAIIVSVMTIRLNDNDSVVNIISLLSSVASITLAIVAIWQSSYNNSESNKTLEKFNTKLDFMDKNLASIQNHILKEAKEAIEKSQIPEEEKEEVIEILRKQQEGMKTNVVLNNIKKYDDSIMSKYYIDKYFDSVTSKYCGNKINAKDNVLSNQLKRLDKILSENIENKVRYRIEGENEFQNDILISYKIEKNNVEITLKDRTIANKEIKEVSFSEYDDRIDFWLYGEKTNRFNLNKNPN